MTVDVNNPKLVPGDTCRHPTFGGIALWFVGYREYPEFDEFDPGQPTIHIDHDTAVVRMVGDRTNYEVPFDEVEPVDRDEFCGGCGQIGCTHDGRSYA